MVFSFKKSTRRVRQRIGDCVAKLKQHKSRLEIEQDAKVIRCRQLDVLIELSDALTGHAAKVEEGSKIYEGYGLKDGAMPSVETARFRECASSLPTPSPSEVANNLHLYGTCLDKVEPIRPPLNVWNESKMSVYGKPEQDILLPPPKATPPDGLLFPEALGFRLNEIRDNRWRRGFYYMSNYDPSDSDAIYERMMHITMPPNVGPREFFNGEYTFEPIPDMVKMPMSIPFVDFVGGDQMKPVSYACAHTMPSLAQYAEAPQIQRIVDKLLPIVWGCPAHGDIPATRPIFEIDGLKRNDRSARPDNPESSDGSYNLASTIMQGNGVGIAQPAVQSVTDEAVCAVEGVSRYFSQLYRLIIPLSVSKEELDVTDFHAIDNNAYGFGGLEPNNTGLQMNISSIRLGGALSTAIGPAQGWFHTDKHDDHSRWTLFTLFFRVPEGCDPGAFLLARPGLYIREQNLIIIFIVFKGTDLHSGYGSTVDATLEQLWRDNIMKDVEALWNMAGDENRAGFVSYPAHAAFHRSGTMAITPSLTFGNAGNARSHDDNYMTFSSNGRHIAGGAHAHYNRLARELVYLHHNFGQHTGLQGLQDPRDMLKRFTYVDDHGDVVHCDPLPFHAVEDAQLLAYWRGRYKWHYMACEQHRIGVNKHHYKRNQAKLKQALAINPSELDRVKTRGRIPQPLLQQPEYAPLHSQDAPDSPLTEYDYSSSPSNPYLTRDAPPNHSGEAGGAGTEAFESASTHNMEPSPQLQTPGDFFRTLSQTNDTLMLGSAPAPLTSGGPETEIPVTFQADDLSPTFNHATTPSIDVDRELPASGHTLELTVPSSEPWQELLGSGRIADSAAGISITFQADDLSPNFNEAPTSSMDIDRELPASAHTVEPTAPPSEARQELLGSGRVVDLVAPLANLPALPGSLSGTSGMTTRQTSKKRKYDSSLRQSPMPQPNDIESQSPENCEDNPAKRHEYDITSDNEEFDDRTDIEEDDEDDNGLELSHEKFDVQDIIGRRILNGHVQYKVKWVGYDEPEWVFAMAMSGCQKLTKRFLATLKGSHKTASAGTNDQNVPTDVLSERSIAQLTGLLSPENLAIELSQVSLPATSRKQSRLPINDIITTILQQRRHGQAVDSLSHDTLTNSGATTILSHLVSTVDTLSSLSDVYEDICLAQRAIGWEISRSLSIVARWYTSDGPTLARHLCDIHKAAGLRGLQVRFPIFAKLIHHMLAYVEAIHASKPGSGPKSRSKSPSHACAISSEALREIPTSFLGLTEPSDQTYRLPEISPHSIGADSNRHYWFVEQLFVRAISDFFISKSLKSIDTRLNGPRRTNSNVTPKLGDFHPWIRRTILRGAIIDTVVEACEGDDGILASKMMGSLLQSPANLCSIPGHETNDQNLSRKLLNEDTDPLRPLRSWLKDFIQRFPDTLTEARKLGDTVYERICSRHGLKSFPRFNPLAIRASAQPRKSILKGSKNSSTAVLAEVPLTLEVLLPTADDDVFSQLGLIMREALNKRRSLPAGDIRISRLMQGLHPTTGLATGAKDLDHFDPVRLDNAYTRMLNDHFTHDRLLGPFGLTNLFVWMSTGQGAVTAEFVKFTDLWFEQLVPCVRVFRNAQAADDSTKFYNTRIWGTTCASFGVETQKFTMEEKFEPFFDDHVKDDWREFLGDRYESTDLTSHPGPLPTFQGALDLLDGLCKKLKLHGFNDGLTNLQFANNLASFGLCQEPTVDEIAAWIFKHQKKGAFKGLLALGFKIQGRPEHWTKAAFQCVYDHLSATLSPKDHDELRFGAIFVEHILCKVSRFAYIIRKAGRSRKASNHSTVSPLSLHQIALDACRCSKWVREANPSDRSGKTMPIPAVGDRARLDGSVQLWA